MTETTEQKAKAFRALHEGEGFVMPNPWDAGTAKMFAGLGFQALATTSAGFAFTLGRPDGDVTLDDLADHVAGLDAATPLPISVDLENGFGHAPEDAAKAITRAAEAGAVGGSIEDYGGEEEGIYEIAHATERVAAAAEAARALPFDLPLPRAPRTTSAATPTSTTRSSASRPTRRPAPTSSMRRA